MLLLLIGYLLARAALGGLVNPPYNGPDEAGHVEYVESLLTSGGRRITGVEDRQPPLYYVVAALPWSATAGQPESTRLFATRLVSGLAGAATLGLGWAAARLIWPARPALAVVAAAGATLAPGHLYLLASVSNDPLAAALASSALLAALRLVRDGRPARRWWWLWAAAGAAALATKPTTAPVVVATAAVLAVRHRRAVLARRPLLAVGAAAAAVAVALYAWLLTIDPMSSFFAAVARYWPLAALRALPVYVSGGGGVETFRTFWYAYDYAVRWAPPVEWLLGGGALAVSLAAVLGLALGARRETVRRVPPLIWIAVAAQGALVVIRYAFADMMGNDMAGAAQAKALFPAAVPLGVVLAAGLGSAGRAVGWADRRLAAGFFGWLLCLDGASLLVTLWHHYRWWQVGL